MNFESWDKVYPKISAHYRILLFNRLGVGSSAKATVPQSGKIVIDEMEKLFLELDITPPYFFVAHSLGGVFANLYACTRPQNTSGIIFVDSPHPLEIIEQKKFKPPFLLQMINDGVKNIEKLFDNYKFSEDECINETLAQIQNSNSFPDIPIAIVSGTKKMPFVPEESFDIHISYQKMLLELSNRSTQYLCEKSGHFPQITEPEIVVKAIKSIVDI
jgi:pimeloyl-ACP methyl ester carboxylesterase